jgi:hypothetical protein
LPETNYFSSGAKIKNIISSETNPIKNPSKDLSRSINT